MGWVVYKIRSRNEWHKQYEMEAVLAILLRDLLCCAVKSCSEACLLASSPSVHTIQMMALGFLGQGQAVFGEHGRGF